MHIVGLSAFYHDSSCCLLHQGKLVAAAAEERFSRVKNDAGLPVQAFRYCLQQGGIDIAGLDVIAYYEQPREKWRRQQLQGASGPDPGHVERVIREQLGFEGPILFFDHHQSHAASAFYFSGFDEAAILTVDGVGEWTTTAYGFGNGSNMNLFEEVQFPHSLGLFYATITAYLGFRVNDGEYKVMGLAAYGKPRFVRQMRRLVEIEAGGQFRLNLPYFDFVHGKSMYSGLLCELLGQAPRQPGEPLTAFHHDIAHSAQLVLEEILLEKVRWLADKTGMPNLCMAGGVALNGVANGRILREGPFQRLFVQPAAGDGGACLGAAALAWLEKNGRQNSVEPLRHVFLGPAFSTAEIGQLLHATGLPYLDFSDNEAALLEAVADRLEQRQIIGWFQGAMEFGPRALGARSILANPMDAGVRERLNLLVKRREPFRPFAPSVLEDHAAAHFALDHNSPFMLETCRVISPLSLPGISHVDGSARPQTVNARQAPRFAALLEAFFHRTGCPVLLNTSFNIKDEPIVCTPADALFGMINAGLDCLVMDVFLIDKKDLPANLSERVAQWRQAPKSVFPHAANPLAENLYSFV